MKTIQLAPIVLMILLANGLSAEPSRDTGLSKAFERRVRSRALEGTEELRSSVDLVVREGFLRDVLKAWYESLAEHKEAVDARASQTAAYPAAPNAKRGRAKTLIEIYARDEWLGRWGIESISAEPGSDEKIWLARVRVMPYGNIPGKRVNLRVNIKKKKVKVVR